MCFEGATKKVVNFLGKKVRFRQNHGYAYVGLLAKVVKTEASFCKGCIVMVAWNWRWITVSQTGSDYRNYTLDLTYFRRSCMHCCLSIIGGFNQRQGEALPPQISLTLSRFVFTVQTRKIWSVYSQENYRNCCHLMSDFKAKKVPNSISAGRPRPAARGAHSAHPDPQLTPSPLTALRASKQLASPNMYP